MADNLFEKFSKEQLFILKCARTFDEDKNNSAVMSLILSNLNWEYILNFSQSHGISPLLYKYLNSCGAKNMIPEQIYEKFRNHYFLTFSKNTRAFDAMGKLIRQFYLEGIDSILLKGSVLAELIYRDIGLRPMDDIDLLIAENKLREVEIIMQENGYNAVQIVKSGYIGKLEPRHHLPQFIKDNNIFEIHWHLHNENPDYCISIDDLWKRALPVQINNINVKILRFEDMLLHLCIHLNDHFSYGKVRFTNFCDIAEILRMDRLNWEFIITSSKKYNIETIVLQYVKLIGRYFDIKLPTDIPTQNIDISDLEKRFYALLQNKNYNRKDFNNNVRSLSDVSGIANKLKYFLGDLFPTKEFMITRFQIRKKGLVYFYYPLRFLIGIGHVFLYMFTRKTK